MRVLVACENSGRVRDAFRSRGHDAWSCDLLESSAPGPHLVGDALSFLDMGWDMMIAHPPCTYLAVSGYWRVYHDPDRAKHVGPALDFVVRLMAAPVPRICIENPRSIISSRIMRPSQMIHPWWFGHNESKSTCLWLKNLPDLEPTNMLPGDITTRRDNQTPSGNNKLGPSADRWKIRSMTYPGIAAAMADQWGRLGPLSPGTGSGWATPRRVRKSGRRARAASDAQASLWS